MTQKEGDSYWDDWRKAVVRLKHKNLGVYIRVRDGDRVVTEEEFEEALQAVCEKKIGRGTRIRIPGLKDTFDWRPEAPRG